MAVVFGAKLSLKWWWLNFPNGDQRSGWSTNSQINVFYACQFSVFMGHKESLGMRLCPWPIFIFVLFDVYPWLLSFKLGIQAILETYYLLHWHTDYLNFLLRSISPYTLCFQSTHQQKYHCASPLAYKLTLQDQVGEKHKYKAIKYFQCTGYLHIQMLIQMPLSDSPIIIFNTFLPCIRLIFNPMPLAYYFQVFWNQRLPWACNTWLYHTISALAFRTPFLLLVMIIVNAHKNSLSIHLEA